MQNSGETVLRFSENQFTQYFNIYREEDSLRIVQQTLENLSKFECNVGNQMAIESNEAIWKLLLWIKNLKGSIENSMLKELKQLLQKSYKSKVPTQMLQIVITELGLLFYKSHYLRISKILHLLKLNDFRENQLLINPRNRIEYLEISFIVLMLFSSREILASKKCHIVKKATTRDFDDLLSFVKIEDCLLGLPTLISTNKDIKMLADIFLPKVDQFEKVWFKMADSTSKFYKIDEMNILYWRGLFLNELSTFEKDEELKLQFAVNSMHQFDLLLENCFQPEKLNELAKNRCEETHTIFINATHCNNLNHLVVIGNYTQHVLQNIVPDVYQWLDKTNKMRQKYLFQMKSFINYMDQCKEKPINVSEVYYNIGEQHRHIILTNRNLQLEQLSYSTPFIEKYCVSEQMRLAKLSLKLGEPMESFFRSTLKKIDSSRFIVRFRQKLWTPDYGY